MRVVLSIFILLSTYTLKAQVIVNAYAKVNSIASGNILSVNNVNETFHTFNPGEKVIIMQMQDDVIGTNTANNISFGNLSAINNAGVYEIAVIASTAPSPGTPNIITLQTPLAITFNTSANASVQIITFRNLGANYSTTANIVALPWNGSVGGVVAIETTNNLTLNHSITANAVGFRGGARSTAAGGACQPTIYKTSATTQAYKGEGIYKATDNTFLNGRAKIINGGGGGNEHNGGGAGGGNYSAGGDGGIGWSCATSSGGIGGLSLAPYVGIYRVFMGGGGGGGQQNNSVATPGANGGGIVIVKSPTITTTSACTGSINISANGGNVANSGNDGSGGGGAGGSIVLDVINYVINTSCPLIVTANGGSGGSVSNSGTHGGGGGGGQGAILLSYAAPGSVTFNALNGIGGSNNTPATSFAQSGTGPNNTGVLTGLGALPIELISFEAIRNGNQVNIHWATASEKNNDYFTIERSQDGLNFEEVSEVEGAGNSSNIINYNETDYTPLAGLSYYRLKQTDYSGNYTYSKIVAVDDIAVTVKMLVFPNPAQGKVSIKLNQAKEEKYTISIWDILGKEYYSVQTSITNPNEIIEVEFGDLISSGAYTLSVTSKTENINVKLIIK